jgi:hypothetical protein
MTNGVAAVNVIVTGAGYIAEDTWYEIFHSRNDNGLFSLWIRGGTYTSWESVGTGTDTAHTTSNHMIQDIDTNDEFSHLIRFPYGMNLTPNDIPEIAD